VVVAIKQRNMFIFLSGFVFLFLPLSVLLIFFDLSLFFLSVLPLSCVLSPFPISQFVFWACAVAILAVTPVILTQFSRFPLSCQRDALGSAS
jgi:hypothetical protein